MKLLSLAITFLAAHAVQSAAVHNGNSKPPNIVLLLSDDQDVRMDSLKYMPLLKKHLIDQGGKGNDKGAITSSVFSKF